MKIRGKTIQGPNVATIVLPRSNGEDIVFKFQAILDYDVFDKLIPEVKVPMRQVRGGKWEQDFEEPDYKKADLERFKQRRAWEFITSSAATPGITWDTVDLAKPETWTNYKDEIKAAGITDHEFGLLWRCFYDANSLDDDKIKEARARFLLQEIAETTSKIVGSSSQPAPASTPS